MGIFDFLKKKQKPQEEEIEIEKISFTEITNWIKKSFKKIETEEEQAISIIKQTIKQYIKELKERIAILQEVNVDEKSAQDNYKTIVKSGREKYIEMLHQMFERLENMRDYELKDYIERVNTIFLEFDKISRKNYERATILIGKEMVSIKDTMKSFSKELLELFHDKREIITRKINLEKIQEKINKVKSNEKELEGALNESSELEKNIQEKEKKLKELKKELEELKKSKDYLENLSNQRKIKTLEEDLNRDLMNLKQSIDFKALANFFHINPKQMDVVKECREDFQSCFMKDKGNSIIKLLEESKLNNRQFQEKFHEIKDKISDLENTKKQIKEDPSISLENQIQNTESEIEQIQEEQEKTHAREIQYEESKQELMNSLSNSLKKMDVELID